MDKQYDVIFKMDYSICIHSNDTKQYGKHCNLITKNENTVHAVQQHACGFLLKPFSLFGKTQDPSYILYFQTYTFSLVFFPRDSSC